MVAILIDQQAHDISASNISLSQPALLIGLDAEKKRFYEDQRNLVAPDGDELDIGKKLKHTEPMIKLPTKFTWPTSVLRPFKCDIWAILLTLTIFSAGLYSWEDKRQLPSVVAASSFSIALAISTYLEGVRRNPYPLLLTSVGLMGVMEMRWVVSGHYVPPGLLFTFATLLYLRHMLLLYKRHPTK